MSLMASPVGDVFDGPEVLTISPAELIAPLDLHSGDEDAANDLAMCYALLEFPDSYYPLNVTNVVIGRDLKIQRLMERSSDIWVDGKMVRKHPNKRKRSIGSPDEEEEEYDSDADSYYDSAPSLTLEEGTTLVGGIGGMQVDPVYTGENEQFIAVHPPADERTGQIPGLTSISKEHLRISFKDGIGWTMEILGRNGAYLNDEHWPKNDEVRLEDKDRIMIVGLQIVFRLCGPMEWDTGSVSGDEDDDDDDELSSPGSETMTVDPLDEKGHLQIKTLSAGIAASDEESSDDEDDEAQVLPITPASKPKIKLRLDSTLKPKPKVEKVKKPTSTKPASENSTAVKVTSEEGKPIAEKKPVSEKEVQDTEVLLQSLLAPGEVRPERRGPGRPPKNGVMSKREMRARQKAVKAGLPYEDALAVKAKGSSKTRDDADGDDLDADGEARKRKKIRRSETAGEDGSAPGQSGVTSDDETKKDLLTPKPPREPTPKEEDYPEERLQKPEGTYQALLHQVLSEAPTPMALQQIYEDVKKRWPYYRFRVQSNGWESSVRHNLQSNTCFMKAGKEGKGHLWTIDPNVAFEPKPKRASPPPHPQPYYHHGPAPPGMQQPRPGIMHGQMAGGPYAHPYPGPYGQPPTMINGHRPPIPAKPQAPTQYSSPYSPNTAVPGQPPRPVYQPCLSMGSAPAGIPPRPYAAHPPAGYRPPPPGMLHTGNPQSAPPASRPVAPGQPLPNQPINRVPTLAPGHLPNQALSRPSSLAPVPLGTQIVAPTQRISAPGPALPQNQQVVATAVNPPGESSALEQVFKGEMPEIFTRFKENLRNMSGPPSTPSQELQINQQIDQTVEWIMSNARRPDFATCEVVDKPEGVKSTVRILRQMLYDDHRTFKLRIAGTTTPVISRSGVASPVPPQVGQGTPLSRPAVPTGGPVRTGGVVPIAGTVTTVNAVKTAGVVQNGGATQNGGAPQIGGGVQNSAVVQSAGAFPITGTAQSSLLQSTGSSRPAQNSVLQRTPVTQSPIARVGAATVPTNPANIQQTGPLRPTVQSSPALTPAARATQATPTIQPSHVPTQVSGPTATPRSVLPVSVSNPPTPVNVSLVSKSAGDVQIRTTAGLIPSTQPTAMQEVSISSPAAVTAPINNVPQPAVVRIDAPNPAPVTAA